MKVLIPLSARLFVAALAATLAVLAFPAGPGGANMARPSWLPGQWYRLGVCETGLRWRWNSGTYEGAFGIYHGTWDTYRRSGEPAAAYLAGPKTQLRVARRIAARHSMYAWGCWKHGWVRDPSL